MSFSTFSVSKACLSAARCRLTHSKLFTYRKNYECDDSHSPFLLRSAAIYYILYTIYYIRHLRLPKEITIACDQICETFSAAASKILKSFQLFLLCTASAEDLPRFQDLPCLPILGRRQCPRNLGRLKPSLLLDSQPPPFSIVRGLGDYSVLTVESNRFDHILVILDGLRPFDGLLRWPVTGFSTLSVSRASHRSSGPVPFLTPRLTAAKLRWQSPPRRQTGRWVSVPVCLLLPKAPEPFQLGARGRERIRFYPAPVGKENEDKTVEHPTKVSSRRGALISRNEFLELDKKSTARTQTRDECRREEIFCQICVSAFFSQGLPKDKTKHKRANEKCPVSTCHQHIQHKETGIRTPHDSLLRHFCVSRRASELNRVQKGPEAGAPPQVPLCAPLIFRAFACCPQLRGLLPLC